MEYKIVLLGEGAVGKTSILLQYTKKKFEPDRQMTIEASFRTKKLNINEKPLVLNLWDTAGQERFHSLALVYYRDADAAVLVFDVTDRTSFDRVQNWVQELHKNIDYEPVLAIAANKIDLPKAQHEVSAEEGEAYAKSVGAEFFLTSAKEQDTIAPMFLAISRKLLAQKGSRGGSKQSASGGRKGLTIEDDVDDDGTQGGGCGC